MTQHKNVSDATAALIDEEVRRLIDEAEAKARKVLGEHGKDLKIIAEALLEYETLTGKEVDALLKGESIVRDDQDDISKDGHKSSVPTSGKGKKRPGGLEAEPQLGS